MFTIVLGYTQGVLHKISPLIFKKFLWNIHFFKLSHAGRENIVQRKPENIA